jgi:hypothetical protein
MQHPARAVNDKSQHQKPDQDDQKLPRRCLHALASVARAAIGVKLCGDKWLNESSASSRFARMLLHLFSAHLRSKEHVHNINQHMYFLLVTRCVAIQRRDLLSPIGLAAPTAAGELYWESSSGPPMKANASKEAR